MDNFSAHTHESVIKDLKDNHDTEVIFFPANHTNLLQPADVSWNAPFKRGYKERVKQWMEKNWTENEKPKMSKKEVITFIKEAWESISEDVIRNSFKYCGLGNNDKNGYHHNALKNFLKESGPMDNEDIEEEEKEVEEPNVDEYFEFSEEEEEEDLDE